MPSATTRSYSSRRRLVVERRDDEQHEIGARRARLEHLVGRRDEVLAQHGKRHSGPNRFEVGERTAELATLGEHADRARAAELIAAGERSRVGDLRERAARRTGSLDLGDDLDVRRRAAGLRARRARAGGRALRPRRRRAVASRGARVRRRRSSPSGRRALSAPSRRPSSRRLRSRHAPAPSRRERRRRAAPPTPRRATAMSKKKAIVPIVKATSMIVTAVHAAGECPWPGSAVSMLMMLLRARGFRPQV